MAYWRGKVALITGGSAGLGLALARALVTSGASVALVGRDGQRLEAARASLPAGSDVLAIAADVTVADQAQQCVQESLQRWSRLDLVVHCAGCSDRGRVEETPLRRFRELLELNVVAAVACVQAALPWLRQSRGHFVLIGSLASKTAPRYLGAYPTSKFPLAALAQQLRLEVSDEGVHVLLVCPGPIHREASGNRYEQPSAGLPEEARGPAGGARLKAIDPDWLSARILRSCERRRAELIVPSRARWLFAISQLWPLCGDWLLRKKTP